MGNNIVENKCYKIFAIISFAILQSSRFNFHVCIRSFCQTSIFETPSLIRKQITCEKFGYQTTRNNILRHRKRSSAGSLFCTPFASFFTTAQDELSYHIAKKHSAPKPVATFKWKLYIQELPGFYDLRQHRNSQHVLPIKTADADPHGFINEIDDANP